MKGNLLFALPTGNRRASWVLCTLVSTLVLAAVWRVDASPGQGAQNGGRYSSAVSTEQVADFDVLVELCSGGSQIVDDLRRVMELDVCQVHDRYEEIEGEHRRNKEDGESVLEFLVSRLTSFSLRDLPWADVVARVQRRDAVGHSYRVFTSSIKGDDDQRLRRTAPLLLVDRFVDRSLVRRIAEGSEFNDAVAMALGSNGYAYVDPTGTPADGWSEAAERRRAQERAQGALRGVGFEPRGDSPDGEYTTLSDFVVGNPAVASDDVPEHLEDFLDIVDLRVVSREHDPRGRVFPVVPLLSHQYESVGDLVVEHGWQFSENGDGGLRPLTGLVGALAGHATQALARACEERLRTADQAWLHVIRAENVPTALDEDEALWRRGIFAEAMQGVEAGRDCLSGSAIGAEFRVAFEAAYHGRRIAALERLEGAYGAAWRRTFWVGVRLVGCVRLGEDGCDPATERSRYEDQYDRMVERVEEIAWQREQAAQELRKQREAAAAALEQAKTEAAAMIERERIAAEATLRRVETELEQVRVEAEASVRRAEEAHRQAVEVATIEGQNAAELARLNNEHELRKVNMEANAKVRVAELEGQAKVAVARSETERVRARAAADEQVARIRRDQALEVERLRQGDR